MSLNPDAEVKIQELQVLERNLQSILMQKQQIQLELSEAYNALEEVKKTTETIYKMVGSILIVVEKNKTVEELEEKKKILELRNNSLTKQEKFIDGKAHELQQEVKSLLEQSPSSSSAKKS